MMRGVSSRGGSSSGSSFPLGASLTMNYQGNTQTFDDGTVWIAGNPTAPFAYSSTYATCPVGLKIPHAILPGPVAGEWLPVSSGGSQLLAYDPGSSTYCTGGPATLINGDATNGYIYHTSTDAGVTWTLRNAQATYMAYPLLLTSFARMASSATTTVVVGLGGFFATTTDGLVWANHGVISASLGFNSTPTAVYHDGSRFVAVFQNRIFYSTLGVTWTEGMPTITTTSICMVSSGRLYTTSFASSLSKVIMVSDATATAPMTITPLAFASSTASTTYYRIK